MIRGDSNIAEAEEIINLYTQEFTSIKKLMNLYNMSRKKITSILLENNIKIIIGYRKYYIDEDYFEIIDSEEKAYWLGFLYADGSIVVQKNKLHGVELGLAVKDKIHIELFAKCLKTNTPIAIKKQSSMINKETGKIYKRQDIARITICGRKMANNLSVLGCIPRKTLILKYPSKQQVPIELQHHFIRGYFDGDGSISWSSSLGRFNAIQIIGTKDFLNGIVEFIKPDYHFNIKLRTDTDIYELDICNFKGVKDFFNKIYKNSTIYLNRKYDRFIEGEYND